ncbi:hypothetical protein SDC9_177545 [bioreactor metagenome]|uniref:Uncharacterized protein n=1 Tax=bioreactor metagenome TaxID=1076179 RepID=A0A645GTA8_9ZZZZ
MFISFTDLINPDKINNLSSSYLSISSNPSMIISCLTPLNSMSIRLSIKNSTNSVLEYDLSANPYSLETSKSFVVNLKFCFDIFRTIEFISLPIKSPFLSKYSITLLNCSISLKLCFLFNTLKTCISNVKSQIDLNFWVPVRLSFPSLLKLSNSKFDNVIKSAKSSLSASAKLRIFALKAVFPTPFLPISINSCP